MMNDSMKTNQNERKRAERKETFLALGLSAPYFIIFIIFTLIPVLLGIAFSFMHYNPYAPEGNEFIGFKNYANLFNFDLPISKTFWKSFTTMLVFDVVAVPFLIVVPLFLAYFINMRPTGYKIFRAIIFLPTAISVSIMGVVFGNMFQSDGSGIINAWLGKAIPWLSGTPWKNDILRWLVILIASIWWQTGTNFVIFSSALRNVPKSLYEACSMDGGSRLKQIAYVTLPNIRPSVLLCSFNTLISYLSLYGQPFVLNDATNVTELVSPMMFIQKYLSGGLAFAKQTGYICACAIVFGIIVMIFGAVQRKCTAEKGKRSNICEACKKYFRNKSFLEERLPAKNPEAALQNECVTIVSRDRKVKRVKPQKNKFNKSERVMRREKAIAFVVLFVAALFFAFPLIYMFGTSFKSDLDLQLHPETLFPSSWDQWTLKHYEGFLFREGKIDSMPIWMLNSLWSTFMTVGITVILDLLVAYCFVFLKYKGRDFSFGFLMLWMAVPSVLGTAPSYAIFALFKNSLQLTGVASYLYIYTWLILPSCTGIFNVLLMHSFFKSIPKDIVESAKCDGAKNMTIFRRLLVPLAKSTIMLIVLFTFISAWNSLMWPQLLLSGEQEAWWTVTYALTVYYTGGSNWGALGISMATCVFSLIPIIIIFVITQNKMIDGLASSGVKM